MNPRVNAMIRHYRRSVTTELDYHVVEQQDVIVDRIGRQRHPDGLLYRGVASLPLHDERLYFMESVRCASG